MAAALTCPYCGHAIVSDDEAPAAERCPSCEGELLLAYRYQLERARGEIAGGFLYQASDAGFSLPAAVLFVSNPSDRAAIDRFVSGNRLFANLRTRGLVGIHEVSRPTHRRPYVVMDWLGGGTLDRVVGKSGPLDPALVWSMASSLLIGLERAHRALPALVHGQVHPGKIGFLKPISEGGAAVLFGFEWARLVSEQDSSLADSFNAKPDVEVERASALDLRALARSIVYAATGRWIEDGPVANQKAQAAALIPGPMAPFIDRLLCAGTPEGYNSTSVARDEFEVIRTGGERRRMRGPVAAPPPSFRPQAPIELIEPSEYDADDDDDDDDYEDDSPPPVSRTSPPPAPSHTNKSLSSAERFEQLRKQQAQFAAVQAANAAVAEAKAPKSGKGKGIVISIAVAMIWGGFLIAKLGDNDNDNARTPQRAAPKVAPIPDWSVPEPMPEPVPEFMPDPEPEPEPSVPAFAARKWSAKVESAPKGGPIKTGAKCELWVASMPDDSSFNCRWALDCKESSGWTRYYGNDGSGLGTCVFEDDELVHFADLSDDDGDGLMVFGGRDRRPWALFGDRYADPARVMLLRVQGRVKLAEQPSQADPPALVRREGDEIGDEYRVAGLELDRLAASVDLPLDLIEDEDDESGSLDIFALQATIDGMSDDLLSCDAPIGTKVDVALTIAGSTGMPTKLVLTNTINDDQEACLRAILGGAEFDNFRDETMDVNWTIQW